MKRLYFEAPAVPNLNLSTPWQSVLVGLGCVVHLLPLMPPVVLRYHRSNGGEENKIEDQFAQRHQRRPEMMHGREITCEQDVVRRPSCDGEDTNLGSHAAGWIIRVMVQTLSNRFIPLNLGGTRT